MVWLIGTVMLLLLVLLISNRWPANLIFFGATMIFFFAGLLSTQDLLRAFTNETLLGLILLLLVSNVVEKTYFLPWLSQNLLNGKNIQSFLAKLAAFSMLFSSHLNNTAVVATLMGTVKVNRNFAASKLLIPLSYAAIIGGTLTLVGTSTNLIVSSFALDAGLPPIAFYDFAYVGLPISLLGFFYLILVVPRLLPDRGVNNSSRDGKYFLEASISPDSRLIGRSVTANGLRNLDNLYLAEIVRGDRLISPVMPEEILQPNDGLIFTGDVSQISELRKFNGLRILDHIDAIARSTLQEVIIKHDAPVIGRRVKDLNFRTRFDAVVVGVRRGENKLPGKIGPMILQPGDNLILAVGKEFQKHDNLRQNFIFIKPIESDEYLNYRESWLTLGIFLSGLGLTALGIISLFKSMLGALLIYLILGYLPRKNIRKHANLGLLIMIGSSLAIARVLQDYGLAQALAQGIVQVFGDQAPLGALVGIYLATLVLTELVTNNAAAAIIFPIALSTAQQLEVSPMSFVMVVAYAASASFLTPIGYQTNTMVYSLGQYQFKDYFRSGLGLTILYAVLVISLVPKFFPF